MRAPESRLHLFVLGACVIGCLAVSMWPKHEPLPTPSSVGADVKAALERTLGLEALDPEPVFAAGVQVGVVASRHEHREIPPSRRQ